MYYVASLKLSGWLSKTSQYTTDITQAREFNHGEALAMCAKQKANVCVPVSVADMELIGTPA